MRPWQQPVAAPGTFRAKTEDELDEMMRDQLADWHAAGIHLRCHPHKEGPVSWRSCLYAGTVAEFHHHDFDGPLPECCELGG